MSYKFFLFFFSFLIFLVFFSCFPEKAALKSEPEPSGPMFKVSVRELFLRGRQEMEKFTAPGYTEAIKYFEQALCVEPDFYQAYGSLAIAYGCGPKKGSRSG